ncbi:abscisic acid 8'-hydroxylase 4-like [Mangifera indica]|uniref:abscisic acid 8'-hydroxylase 4-like n=1 Tax=Mangifera indica TaxID=29780 RepID=UPI001CF9DAC0|nr:abscisic acid 8'-hydroxylase 4-like [Mangifera indica]
METVAVIICIFLFLSTLLSYYTFLRKRRREAKQAPELPPGSMGWPYIGETLQMYSQDPNVFFATKEKRYGKIFKSSILGYPTVMLASPEAAKFVLVTHAHLFKPTYPRGKEKMIGPSALFFQQGRYHTHLRKLVQTSLAPETIKKLIPDIEAIAISSLNSWAADNNGQIINTYNEMKKFSFDVGILSIFGHLDGSHRENLKKNYNTVNKGYNSFPTNIPGTAYRKALLARKRLSKIVSEIISERKEKSMLEKDLLGHLLSFKDGKGQVLTEDQIADNIIGVLFAAQDTTASVLTWILKYLQDNQKLMEDVKAEQKAIYKSNTAGGKKSLTREDTKNMPLTYRLILESLRMASIISFTFREAVVDVEYKGYLIPKGWKVMPLFRNIHHNPEFFSNPKKFDPSRFEVAPKPSSFMPFGNGAHACPGNELAKLEMLILIHHLFINFRWEVVSSQSGIQYVPFPVPQQGLPARFWKESNSSTSSK